jgi:hypothetical protein
MGSAEVPRASELFPISAMREADGSASTRGRGAG